MFVTTVEQTHFKSDVRETNVCLLFVDPSMLTVALHLHVLWPLECVVSLKQLMLLLMQGAAF